MEDSTAINPPAGHWQRISGRDVAPAHHIHDLWVKEDGSQGWAVGADGLILQYSPQTGWKEHLRLTDEPMNYSIISTRGLYQLWMREDGSEGWAMGVLAGVVRYTAKEGWHRDEQATMALSRDIYKQFWMREDGKEGWAIGLSGGIARYTEKDGWKVQVEKVGDFNRSLAFLSMGKDGKTGWIADDDGIAFELAEDGTWVKSNGLAFHAEHIQSSWMKDDNTDGWLFSIPNAARFRPRTGWQTINRPPFMPEDFWMRDDGKEGWGVGERGHVLHYTEQAGWVQIASVKNNPMQKLYCLHMNRAGTNGWAMGEEGVIYQYTEAGGWEYAPRPEEVTLMELRCIWMNKSGTEGWAAGQWGTFLKYTDSSGWKEVYSPGQLDASFVNAIWLSQDGKEGWAVGTWGSIYRYTKEKGWMTHPQSGKISHSSINTLWMSEDGREGWALGGGYLILRYTAAGGWKVIRTDDEKLLKSFGALWMRADGKEGWAMGSYDEMYKYDDATGWHEFKFSIDRQFVSLGTICMNEKGTEGFAAGFRSPDDFKSDRRMVRLADSSWQLQDFPLEMESFPFLNM